MKNEDTLYWLWLAEKCGVASKYFNNLVEKYDSPFDIYRLDEAEIEQFTSIGKALKAKLCEKDIESSYEILKYCKQNRIDIISYGDKRYPARLRQLQDPPIVLYCKGHFPDLNTRLCVGVVGTRKMSEYGKQSAYKIAYDLAASSVMTVSGMARGIDGVAACASLAAGGETVAVLGCGIDTVYPKEHERLMEEICRHGAVITEYPPKEPPYRHNFPKRNRIISGLCQGVLVVEGSVGSGALITAKAAIEQGREIFAVPGKISDVGAEIPNDLIKEGAYPVLSAGDILKHYEFLYGDSYKKRSASRKNRPEADKVLERYGLFYALGGAEEDEPLFIARKAKRKVKKTEAVETPKAEEAPVSSESYDEALSGLDPVTRRILESIPHDRAVSPDCVVGDGVSVSDAITALTLLELYGMVSSLPGGLYIRK